MILGVYDYVLRVNEPDDTIHFVLHLTILNLPSLKSTKLVIILLTNSRNVLKVSHMSA